MDIALLAIALSALVGLAWPRVKKQLEEKIKDAQKVQRQENDNY